MIEGEFKYFNIPLPVPLLSPASAPSSPSPSRTLAPAPAPAPLPPTASVPALTPSASLFLPRGTLYVQSLSSFPLPLSPSPLPYSLTLSLKQRISHWWRQVSGHDNRMATTAKVRTSLQGDRVCSDGGEEREERRRGGERRSKSKEEKKRNKLTDDVEIDFLLSTSIDCVMIKDLRWPSFNQTMAISLVDTPLFLGKVATLTKSMKTCSSSPSATLTTYLPPNTSSDKIPPAESAVVHELVQSSGVEYLDLVISVSPLTLLKNSLAFRTITLTLPRRGMTRLLVHATTSQPPK